MRSISAVLRMTREQLESRGQLGTQPVYTAVFVGVTTLVLAASFFVPAEHRQKVQLVAGAMGFMALAYAYGTISKRHVMRRNLAQEHEIRLAAVHAIEQIMEQRPTLKELTREQRDTLQELLKKEGPNETVVQLLNHAAQS